MLNNNLRLMVILLVNEQSYNSIIVLISISISIASTFSYIGFSFQSRSKNHNWKNCISIKGKNRKYYNHKGRDSIFGLITLVVNSSDYVLL